MTMSPKSNSIQFSSVAQSFLTLCYPMDCRTPGFLVYHQLPELLKFMSIESVTSPNHFMRCHPHLQHSIFPKSGSFPISHLFTSDGQSIGVSASTSVLPMNIQDWFPLGWTGWISLPYKGLSRVFFSTTVQKHHFFCFNSSFELSDVFFCLFSLNSQFGKLSGWVRCLGFNLQVQYFFGGDGYVHVFNWRIVDL